MWRAVVPTLLVAAISCLVFSGGELQAESCRAHSLYVLSVADGVGRYGRSTLSVVDVPSWRLTETISLLPRTARSLAIDPQGRPWVSYAGRHEQIDDRVQVITEAGAPLTMLRSCTNPEAGIAFAAGRAFIACVQNGLGGRLDVLDANTFARLDTIPVPPPAGGAYYLTAVAASETRVVLAGMTKGPDPKRRYAAITTLDPARLSVTWQSDPIADMDVWSIVPYGDDFLLANVASGESHEAQKRADVLRLRPTNTLDRMAVASSPLWSAVADDVLYLYHNPSWNSVSTTPTRALSAYHLIKRTVTRWPLPDGFDAGGIAVVGNKIVLASSAPGHERQSGIYAFDIRDKLLIDPIRLPGAEKVAPGRL
jgi:hypothetical protein